MFFVGIDIGSTASKVAIRGEVEAEFVIPTGWNSKETALLIQNKLHDEYGIGREPEAVKIISTGYGRVSVPYADKTVTEIT
jgi:activator of 2-hydroxyglutaryl-CoA dehydratase